MSLWRGRVRTILAVLVIAVVFFFLGRGLWTNWRRIPFDQLQFDYRFVILSYICMIAYFSVSAFAWVRLLAVYGTGLSFLRSFQIIATSQLGKYVPGKIWFALGRMYLAKRLGVPERISIITMTLETLLLLITGTMIGVLTVAAPWVHNLTLRSFLAALVLLAGLGLLHPRAFGRFVDFAMRRLRRESVEMNLTYSGILLLVVVYCVCWFFPGLGFFLMVKSFYDVGVVEAPLFIGVFAVAWLAGFVTVLAPSGLGVREGVMTSLLAPHMPISMAIIVALVARVWGTLAEVAFFSISLPAVRKWNPAKMEVGKL